MKIFGKIQELTQSIFRSTTDNKQVIIKAKDTSGADGTFELPTPSGTQELASLTATQTLTNKTINALNNTITNLGVTNFPTSAGNADKVLQFAATTGEPGIGFIVNANISPFAAIFRDKMEAGTASHILVNDGSGKMSSVASLSRSLLTAGTASHVLINNGSGVASSEAQLAGTRGGSGTSNAGTLAWGANNLAFTTSAPTNLTLPTSGTLVTLTGTESLSNKTLDKVRMANSEIIEINLDPTVTATAGSLGTIAIDRASGNIWVKKDAGTTTFWIPLSYGDLTLEPTGFKNRTTSTLAYNSGTREFTLAPTATNFTVMYNGRPLVLTSQTITIPNITAQVNYISLSSTGVLSSSTAAFDFSTQIPVATIFWNPSTSDYFLGDERHGCVMDWATHTYLHQTRGAIYESGAAFNGYVLNSDALIDVRVAVDAAVFHDEDITHMPVARAEIDRCYRWYRLGASGDYTRSTLTDAIPAIWSANVAQYNQWTGSTWQLTNVPNNDFFNIYIFGTNSADIAGVNREQQWIFQVGQATFASQALAQTNENFNTLSMGAVPSKEFISIAKLTCKYSTGYTGNDARIRIIAVEDARRAGSVSAAAGVSSNHNSLSGRSDANAHPDTSINLTGTYTRTLSGQTTAAGAFTALDTHTHVAAAVTDFTTQVQSVTGMSATGGISTVAGTAALVLPAGTTAQRPTPATGMIRFNSTDAAFEGYTGSAWAAVGGGSTTVKLTINSHGFTIGQALYFTGSAYALAKADAANTSEVVGIVSKVIDVNTVEITTNGIVTGLSGLTAGAVYFLSATTAGLLTATEPTTVGFISLPLLTASSTTAGYVNIMRGVVVGGTNVQQSASLLNNTASQFIVDLTGISGGYINAIVYIDATTDARQEFVLLFSKNAVGTTWSISTLSTTGENSLTTFDIDTSGILRASVGNHAGTYTSGLCTYSINSPALGATFPQVVSASNVLGSTSGVAPAAGVLGETVTASITTTTSIGTAVQDITGASLPLTAGNWRIFYSVTVQVTTGATSGNNTDGAILMTDNANNQIGTSARLLRVTTVAAVANSNIVSLSSEDIVNLLSPTTYKLRAVRSDNAGTGSMNVFNQSLIQSTFYAIRIG